MWLAARFPGVPRDFDQLVVAARAMLHGQSPYGIIGPGRAFEWRFPFVYPLPSAIVALPIAWLPLALARACFVGLSVGAMVYAMPRALLIPLLVSQPFVNALWNAQWSIAFTAALLLPSLGWLAVAKPQTGLVLLATHWRRRTLWLAVLAGVFGLVLATLLQQHWLSEWRATLAAAPVHRPPILRPGGFLLALSALRWRRPEGRLLLALACVPQTAMWYAALPLFLIPKTLAQGTLLAGLSQLGFLATAVLAVPSDWAGQEQLVGLLMLFTLYLPALVMVLRLERVPALTPAIASPGQPLLAHEGGP